jgi:hypothetical protein
VIFHCERFPQIPHIQHHGKRQERLHTPLGRRAANRSAIRNWTKLQSRTASVRCSVRYSTPASRSGSSWATPRTNQRRLRSPPIISRSRPAGLRLRTFRSWICPVSCGVFLFICCRVTHCPVAGVPASVSHGGNEWDIAMAGIRLRPTYRSRAV